MTQKFGICVSFPYLLQNLGAFFQKNLFQEVVEEYIINFLPKQVSFIFTPSSDLKAGVYMLMIGAENNDVSYLKAVRINIT